MIERKRVLRLTLFVTICKIVLYNKIYSIS